MITAPPRRLRYFAHPLATVAARDLLLLERLQLRPTDAALEIGTGSGSSLFRLAPQVRRLHGIDVCAGPLNRLRPFLPREEQKYGCEMQLMPLDFCDPGAPDALPNPYDLIYSCDTLEHVPRPAEFLVNVGRALKPGGRLFLTYPNERPEIAHGITFFEHRRDLEVMLTEAGFEAEKIRIQCLRLNPLARTILNAGWTWPRRLVKNTLRWLRRRPTTHNAQQVFDETDFFRVADRAEPLAPVINAYCWGLMRLMACCKPVYLTSPAPEVIWDRQILIEAVR